MAVFFHDQTEDGKNLNFPMGIYHGKPVTWKKLVDHGDDGTKVLAEQGIDTLPFDESGQNMEWKQCSLKKYMNDVMFPEMFTVEKKFIIPEWHNLADDYMDKLCLLTPEEEIRYLSPEERKTVPTQYAIEKGANRIDYYSPWWLAAHNDHETAYAKFQAALESHGERAVRYSSGRIPVRGCVVRPVCSIDFSDD